MISFRLTDIRLAYPGYFTGSTALAFWGKSTEEIVPVQVATYVTDAERDGVLYIWFPDDMFFGYVEQDGVLVATPEKAVADGFWIEERMGIRACDPDDILWDELDATAFADILKRVGLDYLGHIPEGNVRTRHRSVFLRKVRDALGIAS